MNDQEKRIHRRVKRPFTARIRPYQEIPDPQHPVKWDIVTVRNLSASGISFNHTKILPEGMVLEFNIPLPFSPVPIYCRGEVCRMDSAPSGAPARRIPVHQAAVRFTEITDADKAAVDRYLNTL